jgi:hypothetical protein
VTERKPREAWVPRDFIVLTHGGKKIRVRCDVRPQVRYEDGGVLKIGESRFYSVAAVLDPDNAELL